MVRDDRLVEGMGGVEEIVIVGREKINEGKRRDARGDWELKKQRGGRRGKMGIFVG